MSDLDVIKEIEKIIGKKLKPCPINDDIMDWMKNVIIKVPSLNNKTIKLEKVFIDTGVIKF